MRINELPQATSVAQTDDLAIDVPGGRTYKIPRSILAPAPFVVTVPTGQWSGSGTDRYITVTASNVTADAMLYPFFDEASSALLNGPVWCVPAAGSFTIHTSAIPSGTVTISVLLAGILGEAQYQVLADVYSKSQTYSKDQVYTKAETNSAISQSTASLGDPITVAHGGRGMSTASFNVTSSYTTLASAINSIRSTAAFPISFVKGGTHTISDLPSGKTTREFAAICFGDSARMQILLFLYADTGKPYYRQLFNGNWLNDWVQL